MKIVYKNIYCSSDADNVLELLKKLTEDKATMRIAIFDDDPDILSYLEKIIKPWGRHKIVSFKSVMQGYEYLGLGYDILPASRIDLFLIDLAMPEVDGLSVLKTLRSHEDYFDVPVIMMTGSRKDDVLEEVFQSGATDFILKPFNRIEVKSRLRSALRLKTAIDHWKDKEKELLETNRLLMAANQNYLQLTALDGLTGITNRSTFDKIFEMEWKRAQRNRSEIGLLMIDVDYFKQYNDHYGHPAGDDCLRRVAHALEKSTSKGGDLVARYGGEEFVALLPNTTRRGTFLVAQLMLRNISKLNIPHHAAAEIDHVTVSIGAAHGIPEVGTSSRNFLERADKMLYKAKDAGRARIEFEGQLEVIAGS